MTHTTGDLDAVRRREQQRFPLLGLAYALGVFNDNMFRQTALFLAIALGHPEFKGVAAALYAAPFVLLAAPAGWLADRFSKGRVALGAKIAEIGIVLLGGYGMVTHSWWAILSMMGLMGFQSAVFSPALNGSLPELFPEEQVVKVNAFLRIGVTMAILAGTLCSGYVLDMKDPGWRGVQQGHWVAAGVLLAVAVAGCLAGLAAPRRPAANPRCPFPWTGPAETWYAVCELRKDPLLRTIVWADAWVWFSGSLQLMAIVALGTVELGLTEKYTSNLIFGTMVGTAIGGWLSTKLLVKAGWWRQRLPVVLALQGVLLALLPWLLAVVGPATWTLPGGIGIGTRTLLAAGVLLLLGVLNGLAMIPCESFVQVRPAPEHKGRVLAAANALIFTGIIFSGILNTVGDLFKIPASQQMSFLGLATLPILLLLRRSLAKGRE